MRVSALGAGGRGRGGYVYRKLKVDGEIAYVSIARFVATFFEAMCLIIHACLISSRFELGPRVDPPALGSDGQAARPPVHAGHYVACGTTVIVTVELAHARESHRSDAEDLAHASIDETNDVCCVVHNNRVCITQCDTLLSYKSLVLMCLHCLYDVQLRESLASGFSKRIFFN